MNVKYVTYWAALLKQIRQINNTGNMIETNVLSVLAVRPTTQILLGKFCKRDNLQ